MLGELLVVRVVQLVSLFNQCWVRLRGDAHKKNAARIFASSTKMKNNFAIFGNKLYLPGS